ncbi:hypothetical protein EUX98_g742 [Antrodiella citrinella]|uniref:Pyridoxal phosphate homeostasis protein n=1 Tax=Antrodiella citrinella TaxID=2447956 RepID=A0A4S4N382_9APHY|nr:hypothetical protein EUX98_g742 [Antrodiella citrinella]
MTTAASTSRASLERAIELAESLSEIRVQVREATPSTSAHTLTLVAVSKYKPASDIWACYETGQRDFGENYVQELVEKAAELPTDIRWHFIGALQSNKAKILASIPNIYSIQTVSSTKAATALQKAVSPDRPNPLNILLQVNTSGEDSKSGLNSLTSSETAPTAELTLLALHVLKECPALHLQGLMTIGALTESLSDDHPNRDFERLKETRDLLQSALAQAGFAGKWGVEGRLVLSMGMSSDFKAAIAAGSDIVRVGTGIFGTRAKKVETPTS